MKIVIAPDSYKGSLTAEAVAECVERGIKKIYEKAYTVKIPMAATSGLPLITKEERNPLKATTYGTEELIKHALYMGCR